MKYLLTFFVLATMACCDRVQSENAVMDDQRIYIDKMANNIHASAVWVIEHGVEAFRLHGKEWIFRKLLNEWGVQQWVEPVVGGRYLALFRIKGRQMKANIICLARTTDGSVYEYWLVQYSGEEWKMSSVGKDRHCLFLITSASSVDGARRVIYQASQFFPSYKVNERVVVSLPLDNIELQYDMMAWEFPECYPDSDLKNWEIGIGKDGRYIRVPAKR